MPPKVNRYPKYVGALETGAVTELSVFSASPTDECQSGSLDNSAKYHTEAREKGSAAATLATTSATTNVYLPLPQATLQLCRQMTC
jgi:hypothetical protein